MYLSNTRYEILTPDGFKHFNGINKIKHDKAIKITLGSYDLTCSFNHKLYNGQNWIEASAVVVGDKLKVKDDYEQVTLIEEYNTPDFYYDPINVQDVYCYLSNDIVSHNCIFLSSEKLLIDTLVLQNLTELIVKSSPLFELREIKFWKQIETGKMYLVGVDPATGTGNDFSIITVFEFPTMVQVAEYRSNTTSSAVLYSILKNLLRYIEKKSSTVYFSVENNGVGEGIIALYEADENPPELAEFIHDEGKTKRGMTTTPKSKLRACVKLKQVIESNTLHIKSPYLLAELKAFVKQVGGYKAQLNATDDCVSATLIVMRILEAIAPHEQDVHDTLYSIPKDEWEEIEEEYDENNEAHMPMPIIM